MKGKKISIQGVLKRVAITSGNTQELGEIEHKYYEIISLAVVRAENYLLMTIHGSRII